MIQFVIDILNPNHRPAITRAGSNNWARVLGHKQVKKCLLGLLNQGED